jgi:hypothetical protein
MSMGREITLWDLQHTAPPQLHIKLTYTLDILILKCNESCMAFGCKSGKFSVIQVSVINAAMSFQEYAQAKEEGHLKSIVSIDFVRYNNHQLWLTAGEDESIKIWKGVHK